MFSRALSHGSAEQSAPDDDGKPAVVDFGLAAVEPAFDEGEATCEHEDGKLEIGQHTPPVDGGRIDVNSGLCAPAR